MSFIEMTKFLLSNNDDSGLFFLSEKISQDPIEIILADKELVGEGTKIPHFSSVFTTLLLSTYRSPLLLTLSEGTVGERD